MKKLAFLTGLFFISILIARAQNVNVRNTNSNKNVQVNTKRCGTMAHLLWLMQQDPALQQKMNLEEKKINDYITAHGNELKNSKTAYTIPVVVHVVYNGSSGYVSPARVTEQIDRTNSDWAGLSVHSMGPFPDSLKANSEITLCLATVDPGGNPTTGIDYKTTTVSNWTYNNNVKYSSTGGADAWDVTKYLNIWVCNLGGGLCGYAQFPTSGINNTYGVVIHYQFFGITGASAPYNEGGTMSHELGHCFNLFHLFGDITCADVDGCPDTPTEYGTQTVTGNCIIDQCNDTCPGIMYMNFMRYTDDSTMANLTPDQGTRMQTCVQMYLMSVANNAAVGCGTVSIQDWDINNLFLIYPDPAENNITIENVSSVQSENILSIFNVQGKLMLQLPLLKTNKMIDISHFIKGLYFVKVESNRGIEIKKFIKE